MCVTYENLNMWRFNTVEIEVYTRNDVIEEPETFRSPIFFAASKITGSQGARLNMEDVCKLLSGCLSMIDRSVSEVSESHLFVAWQIESPRTKNPMKPSTSTTV